MNVTLVITSCGRTDLLEQTILSFFKFNTYPIEQTIIIEDSGILQDFANVKKIVPTPLKIIINPVNLGQMKSIDLAYSKVKTDYIFHCEEDWEFFNFNFIEKSFEILSTDSKIFTVWLRAFAEKKIGKVIDKLNPVHLSKNNWYYRILQSKGKSWQSGFSLNPGLRKTSDCMKLHPYSNLEVLFPKIGEQLVGERDLSVHYRNAGFIAAITNNENGYIRHIGGKRHILLPWEQQ